MSDDRDVILIANPEPRTLAMIFDGPSWERLAGLGRVVVHAEGERLGEPSLERALAEARVIIGQIDLPAERLVRAGRLRAVINVEGNFLPNVDYAYCFANGIRVLNASPVFALPVAEAALGMAIDLARGITAADRDFRAGRETWGLESNRDAFLLSGSPVGLIGFGDLARELRRLLAPFRCPLKVYDPWLPASLIAAHDAQAAPLDEVLASSRVVFVFASVTTENRAMIGRRELALMPPGSAFLLMSRAGVVDFPALVDAVAGGRIRAATDVFPDEPVAADDPVRRLDGLLLSSHRTGGMAEAFLAIGRLVTDDAELILKGYPPVVCKRAEPETVGRFRSPPVRRS